MPFVRKHGNQVSIVHGERDATGAVQQRVLFSLYSRPEAEAAIGLRRTDPPLSLELLLGSRHEGLRFDWKKLGAAIAQLKDDLPEAYPYRHAGVADLLRGGLVAATKGLLAADPQSMDAAAEALRQHREELLLVRQLIDDRLVLMDEVRPSVFSRDNEYGWKARLAGEVVPPEAWERLDDMVTRGDSPQVEAFAGLLVQAWPAFAEGYNTLGRAALDRGEYDVALAWFAKALEVGRTLFPSRIAKSRWWTDHETRPYIRAMRNTALALSWAGRDAEVLPWSDRLAAECFDEDAAAEFRAAACLNLERWQDAFDAAVSIAPQWPDQDLVAAFAALELGQRQEALARYLRAVILRPRATNIALGNPAPSPPTDAAEVEEHNAGVFLKRSIGPYLKRKRGPQFFAPVAASHDVRAWVDAYQVARLASRQPSGPNRAASEALCTEMGTLSFARARAAELDHLLPC
jgi:tetratricopeptide (TPR) repeat protein